MPQKLMLVLCLCLYTLLVQAQTIQALQPGQTVPDILLHYQKDGKWYNGKLPGTKLTILDFWGTWCSSCIKAFPKMETLQQEFETNLQVLLVNCNKTRDDAQKIDAFFAKWKARFGKPLQLASIANDTILGELFPHTYIPHYVWIGSTGKVLAITSADEVTADNIRSVLATGTASFVMKKDQDTERPLFSNADLPMDQLINYRLFTRGKFEGLGSGNRLRYTNDTLRGRAITNTTIKDMYLTIVQQLNPDFKENRLVLATANTGDLLEPQGEEEKKQWQRTHLCNLDVIVPMGQADRLYAIMLEELNRSSGYHGEMQKRTVSCFVLTVTGKTRKLLSKGGATAIELTSDKHKYLQNAPVEVLLNRLNYCAAIGLPVVNETGITYPVDIEFPNGFDRLETIQKQLHVYGLELVKTERLLDVFVVSDH